RSNVAGRDIEAAVLGIVEVSGIKNGCATGHVFKNAGLQIVDDDASRDGIERRERMLVRRQEVLHRLRDGEFQIHAAAIAQHHDEEAQLPARFTDADRAPAAPVDLRGFAGREHQFEESRPVFRPYQAHIVLDGRATACITGFTQSLEDLLRAERMGVEQTGHLSLEWVEQAGPRHLYSCFVARHAGPGGDGAMRQMQRRSDLRQGHMLTIAAIPDLAPGFIGNHGRLPRAARSAAMCSCTGVRASAGGAGADGASHPAATTATAHGSAAGGKASPRASTWYSGLA